MKIDPHCQMSNSHQRVVVNGAQCSWLPVISGVPQGTVLGPLLILLYINDITYDISSDIRLFADDCIVYRVIRSQSDCIALQADVDRLHSWATTWQITSKCTHILSISHQRNPGLSSYYTSVQTSYLLLTHVQDVLSITVSSFVGTSTCLLSVSSRATRHDE